MLKPAKTIALSRQRGSGGSYVGRLVAERLGLLYVDRELLRHATEYLHVHGEKDPSEAAGRGWWARLSASFLQGGPDCGYVPPTTDDLYEGELFEIQKRLILEIVAGHVAVIVGRGAAQTLKGRNGVMSVFLHAPEAWRVERVQRIYEIADPRAALQMVRTSDHDRARFVHALAGIEWTDNRAYDLSLNTAALGFEASADLILRAAEACAQPALHG